MDRRDDSAIFAQDGSSPGAQSSHDARDVRMEHGASGAERSPAGGTAGDANRLQDFLRQREIEHGERRLDANPEHDAHGEATIQAAHEDEAQAPKPRNRRKIILLGVLLTAILGGAVLGYRWWTVGRFMVSTDDAYIHADMTTLAAKIPGYIATVPVANNQSVKKGDVIATLDDGDYSLALQAAEDKIATQQASITRLGEQAKAGQAAIDQAKAQVSAAQAELTRASQELNRQSQLAKSDFASQQKLDAAQADKARAQAALAGAEAAVRAAQANLAVLNAQQTEAEHVLNELKTARDKAARDLSFTKIRAPFDGVIGNKAVEVGQYVQPGARLAALVPLDNVYIDANFKETQLRGLKPGQPVEIDVDAYPNSAFHGTVVSISPASGSVFSLLPPENATGNFTKIVQRIPVRIQIAPDEAKLGVLRPGMSIIATVDTRKNNGASTQAASR